MIELRPYQSAMVEGVRQAYRAGKRAVLLNLPTGGGKCLGKGTPVLMFDGSVKPVEQVSAGELLVGPDSLPRRVLSTCSGREMLYRVTPTKGEPYVVNESHILSLRLTGLGPESNGRYGGQTTGQVVNIDVLSYLAKSVYFRHIAKGWRAGVDWHGSDQLPVDPYFLGIWLGDGRSGLPAVTSVDAEITAVIQDEADRRGLNMRREVSGHRAPQLHITAGNIGGAPNPLTIDMRAIGVMDEKHIPLIYKRASRADRLALLAGLVDSDGHLSKADCYDFVFKSQRLADDVIFLARSLGFAAYRKASRKVCGNNGKAGDYHRFMVTGGVSEIPARLPRKQSPARSQKKNVLNVGIKVEPIGEGEYYGFEIDGDRLFLLGDFTVTHNTVTASHIVHGAAQKGNVCWWLTHRKELAGQASATFHGFDIPHGTIRGGWVSDPNAIVQVASIQTIVRRLDKLPEPSLIVFDETHHIGAKSWDAIFNAFPRSKVLGLTATPWRLDGAGLGRWYQHMVTGPTPGELIDAGSLSPYRLFAPAMPDLSGVETVAGDYAKGALAKAMDKPAIVGDAISHYRQLCAGKRAVVFAVSVEHSQHIAAQFNAAGIPAEHVDGTTPDDQRDAALERFRRGETLILSNVDLFGEGFDVPAIEAAILLRPTKSLSLYLQQAGRALRPFPGKDHAIILDHAGNSLAHGLPDDVREWSLADRPKRAKGEVAEVAIRQCKECFFVYRPAPACPQCGHVPPVAVRAVEVVEGVLEEVKRTEKRQQWKEERECRTLEDWMRLAERRGYKPGWAIMRFRHAKPRQAA